MANKQFFFETIKEEVPKFRMAIEADDLVPTLYVYASSWDHVQRMRSINYESNHY